MRACVRARTCVYVCVCVCVCVCVQTFPSLAWVPRSREKKKLSTGWEDLLCGIRSTNLLQVLLAALPGLPAPSPRSPSIASVCERRNEGREKEKQTEREGKRERNRETERERERDRKGKKRFLQMPLQSE